LEQEELYWRGGDIEERDPKCKNHRRRASRYKLSPDFGISQNTWANPEISGGIIEEILDRKIVDEIVQVTDQEAIDMAHRLMREEGLFAGVSSGANVLVAMREAERLGKGKTVVTVLQIVEIDILHQNITIHDLFKY